MKIYKLSQEKVNVANVGSFGSPDDESRRSRAAEWIVINDLNYSENKVFSDDHIDLNNGRDFLKESKQYDIVILHHIFNASEPYMKGKGIFQNSPLHSSNEWIKRLQSTGADYIFVFGGFGEVSGGWLGNIPGYDVFRDDYETVYRNQRLPKIEVKPKKPIDWDNVDVSWIDNKNNSN